MSLDELATVARREFADLVQKTTLVFPAPDTVVPSKLRLHLVDGSKIDVWLNAATGRYSFNWMGRIALNNAPHHRGLPSFPRHAHLGPC